MNVRLFVVVVTVGWLAGGSGLPGALRAGPLPLARPEPVLVGAGAEALADEESAFARLSVERGAEAAWLAYCAADAVQLPADRPPLHGLGAIIGWLRTEGMNATHVTLDWWPLHAEVAASGELGYTFGDWEFRRKDAAPDAPPLARGKFASVWKKQPDGLWKVIFDTGNTEPARKP